MKSCYSKPSRGYVCQIFFSTTKLELLFKNLKLNIETRMSCMETDFLVKVIKPSRGHNPQGHRLLRDIHDKRHLTSNTFNFRFHVRQEFLLVNTRMWIRFGSCSSVSFWYVAHRFSPVLPILLTIGLNVCAQKMTVTLSLSREAPVCILWTLGVLLFHWLAAFCV